MSELAFNNQLGKFSERVHRIIAASPGTKVAVSGGDKKLLSVSMTLDENNKSRYLGATYLVDGKEVYYPEDPKPVAPPPLET